MNLFLIIVIFIIMIRLRLIQYGYFKANFQNKSHYEILGLKKGASEADIKKKYY